MLIKLEARGRAYHHPPSNAWALSAVRPLDLLTQFSEAAPLDIHYTLNPVAQPVELPLPQPSAMEKKLADHARASNPAGARFLSPGRSTAARVLSTWEALGSVMGRGVGRSIAVSPAVTVAATPREKEGPGRDAATSSRGVAGGAQRDVLQSSYHRDNTGSRAVSPSTTARPRSASPTNMSRHLYSSSPSPPPYPAWGPVSPPRDPSPGRTAHARQQLYSSGQYSGGLSQYGGGQQYSDLQYSGGGQYSGVGGSTVTGGTAGGSAAYGMPQPWQAPSQQDAYVTAVHSSPRRSRSPAPGRKPPFSPPSAFPDRDTMLSRDGRSTRDSYGSSSPVPAPRMRPAGLFPQAPPAAAQPPLSQLGEGPSQLSQHGLSQHTISVPTRLWPQGAGQYSTGAWGAGAVAGMGSMSSGQGQLYPPPLSLLHPSSMRLWGPSGAGGVAATGARPDVASDVDQLYRDAAE